MQDIFITKINIGKVRHLNNIDIVLSKTERKHLVLTGKNGCGKTSLLEAIRDCIRISQRDSYFKYGKNGMYNKISPALITAEEIKPNITIDFSTNIDDFIDAMFVYVSAKRNSKIEVPKVVESMDVQAKTIITRNASKEFLKYILNLYVQYLSAKDLGSSPEDIEQYNEWFNRFKQALRDIYDCQELELKPDMKKLEFIIIMPNREPFGLHEMSDGYTAFIEILMELLIRLGDENGIVDYNQSATVIIDELETHLHVELQKRALPFLTQMFPNVQFVVSTHSPFVITSLSNAVVYDLEKQDYLDNPSYYSYESVVESFLDSDMYSETLKKQLNYYEQLALKNRTPEENIEFLKIKAELELISPASKELFIAFHNIEKRRKELKHG